MLQPGMKASEIKGCRGAHLFREHCSAERFDLAGNASIKMCLGRIDHEIAALERRVLDDANRVVDSRDRFANPFVAASRGYVDEIIQPRTTRPKLIAALASCDNKREPRPPRKHGNIPL